MELPIVYKLKRESQRKLAELQDEVIEVVYSLLEDVVIHGGTAIWRCYGGKRFSEDIDLYADYKEDFKEKLEKELKKRGLSLLKFRETENTLFSQISDNVTNMSLEITRKKVHGTLKIYWKANGNSIDVLTLTEKELMLEKIAAYNDRHRIRDIYDVYFLSRFVNDRDVKDTIRNYLLNISKPVDEDNLKAIVYEGKVPTFLEMLEELKIWAE